MRRLIRTIGFLHAILLCMIRTLVSSFASCWVKAQDKAVQSSKRNNRVDQFIARLKKVGSALCGKEFPLDEKGKLVGRKWDKSRLHKRIAVKIWIMEILCNILMAEFVIFIMILFIAFCIWVISLFFN